MENRIDRAIDDRTNQVRINIRNKVGNWLKLHRQQKGYTIEMASRSLKTLTPQQIYDIENGEACLFLKHLERFIGYYEIHPRDYVEFLSHLRALIK